MNKYVLLRIEKLKKIYNNRLVLDIPSLAFEQGKIYAIVGPNGSGKTTLINILSLLDIPDNGKIFFQGKEIKNISKNDLLKIRRQITLVHQKPFLFQTTVYNNIAYGLKIRRTSYSEQEKRIKEVLKIVGLSGFEQRESNQLSGGEAQRVVIARALAIEPNILFLDEPTANIDKRYIDAVERIIKKINHELNNTVIFTTHDLSQAYRLADTIISLLDGRIIQHIPENIFKGKIIQENGLQWCKITEEIKFALVSKRRGYIYIYIAPSDIILSNNRFSSSTQNSFMGKVTKISEHNHLIRLAIDIGVELVSVVTRDSFLKMNINIGSTIWLTFKASAVKCF